MATKKNIIKGTTRSGIEFQLDENIKDDARLLYLLTQMQRNDIEWSEKSNALFKMLELVFGGGEGLQLFMDEVANAHKGICSTEAMMGELNDMFETLNAKKS